MCRKVLCLIVLVCVLGPVEAWAQDIEWIRAAYWDGRYPTAWGGGGEATRDALEAAGYEVLDADQLKAWMDARIADKELSVVVFCRDVVPDTVAETQSATCTMRRYLDAGGKIVWYSDWPFYYQGSADGNMVTWSGAGATSVLGFNASTGPNDSYNVVAITPMGIKWGLTEPWESRRPTSPTVTPNLTVLATDDAGNAAAWAKHFVPNDSFRGFVRIYDRAGQTNAEDIMRVAEYASLNAWNPNPADGATAVAAPLLEWSAGPFALWHDVYFGTNPEPGPDEHIDKQLFTMYWHLAGLEPGATHYWRIDEIEPDGTVRTGDVWSFVAQDVKAYYPNPTDGANDASTDPNLTWLPGTGAAEHQVYFGDTAEAVGEGAAGTDKGTVAATAFAPGALDALATYFWRVDTTVVGGEVKAGPVWSFTTAQPVDDMESYTDEEGSRIYETWLDGWANSTGSIVGYLEAPFAELTIVHGGAQSMPLDYNNVNAPFYSEAEQEFSPTQDWTAGGIDTLILSVQGQSSNGVAPLYVVVEDSAGSTATVVHPDPAVVRTTTWIEWTIPLSEFAGVNMARVKKVYIGVGDRANPAAGGSGLLYIDDIRLTKP